MHRDLKPENLFLTKDGRVKILDFGLAKLKTEKDGEQQTDLKTVSGTEPGVVLGTMGYMSPEQVRGKAADRRSDLFSFGTILYEMLSGQRAFRGDTAADTITAILTQGAAGSLDRRTRTSIPGLDRIVRHCLEKNPEERFESARDVAFDLESLSSLSAPAGAVAAPFAAAKRRRVWPLVAGAVLATALAVGVPAYLAGRKAGDQPPPSFRQLTFRRGEILSAHFAPDGTTVVYSAAWDGKPVEIFVGRLESPESRPFGLAGRRGPRDLEARRGCRVAQPPRRRRVPAKRDARPDFHCRGRRPGTSWRMSSGRTGRRTARISPSFGRTMAKSGSSIPSGRCCGRRADGSAIRASRPRETASPSSTIPSRTDDGGSVAVVDRAGRKTALSKPFSSVQGLAWGPDGAEVWFTAAEVSLRALYSASLSGDVRLRSRVAGNLTLRDISAAGRLLVTRDTFREEMRGLAPGESKERDLTWLDYSLPTAISADGRTVLFTEGGEGGGPGYSVYVRETDGSPAVRLGEGFGQALSPDRKWAIAIQRPATDPQLVAYPTGAGEARVFPKEGLSVLNACWFPDGKKLLFTANEPGRGPRLYERDFEGGKPRALTPEGYRGLRVVSPDGKWAVVTGPDRKTYLYPLAGGEPTVVSGVEVNEVVAGAASDSRSIYVYRRGEIPTNVSRLDVTTGHRQPWRSLAPADAGGVSEIRVPFRRRVATPTSTTTTGRSRTSISSRV